MRVNNINSTSFGTGDLTIFDNKKKKIHFIDASNIEKIAYDFETKKTTVTYPYKKIGHTRYMEVVEVHPNVPLERVLAAYTAAMVAPSSMTINVM